MAQQYFIGTSGWVYPEWKNAFYPQDVAQRNWLAYYAQQFSTVEINSTFYHLPKSETVKAWYQQTPKNFTFATKLSRFITHLKHLQCDEDLLQALEHYFVAIKELREKLAVILVQLPANLHRDDERLKIFIDALQNKAKLHQVPARFAIEFRHDSWFCEPVFTVLKQHNIASVINSAPQSMAASTEVTADFLYARFHGAKRLYQSEYSEAELRAWLETMRQSGAKRVFAYFNNTMELHALKNAKQLIALAKS